MDNYPATVSYKAVQKILTQYGRGKDPLAMIRVFIGMTGDHVTALMLNQAVYWSGITRDKEGWFYKTAKDWDKELGLTYFQLSRSSELLSRIGMETATRHVNKTPTTHYRLKVKEFYEGLFKYLETEECLISTKSKLKKLEIEETETPKLKKLEKHKGTETTTETTERDKGARARGARGKPHPLPEDFSVTEEMRQWAADKAPGVDVDVETEKFINHALYKGRECVTWDRAWRNWLLNSPEKQRARASPSRNGTKAHAPPGLKSSAETVPSAIREAMERRKGAGT